MDIDEFRRELAKRVSQDFAAKITGMVAEYSQQAYMEGYNKGYTDGRNSKVRKG